jgi:hypothetical protein
MLVNDEQADGSADANKKAHLSPAFALWSRYLLAKHAVPKEEGRTLGRYNQHISNI